MNLSARATLVVVGTNLAALPIAMRALLLVLLGHHNTGSYAVAGAGVAAAAVGLALTSPLFGRALGRYGHRRVLATTGAAAAAAQVGLAVTGQQLLSLALAGIVGLTTPPATSSVRALLPELVPRESLGRAYTYNAIAQELIYVTGPLWVSLWLGLAGPPGALLASAAIGTAGLAVAAIAVPATAQAPLASRPSPSPLRRPGVQTLVTTHIGYMASMGAMWVLVPAFATGVGRGNQAVLLVTCCALASAVGGLAFAARGRGRPPHTAYLLLLGLLAVTALPLTLPSTVPQMAIAIAVFGLGLSPWLAVADELVSRTAPKGNAGEAYGWLVTAGTIGSATGSITAGAIADAYTRGPVFLLVGTALLVALAIAIIRRRTLQVHTAPTSATPAAYRSGTPAGRCRGAMKADALAVARAGSARPPSTR